MTYAASITHWLNVYGPVAWGAAGIVSLLVLALVYSVWGWGAARFAIASYTRQKAAFSSVNALASTHEDERIELAQLYSPYSQLIENARFENCDLIGPFNIVLGGCTLTNSAFSDCSIVIVRSDRAIVSALVLKLCTVHRCRIHRAVFFMTHAQYLDIPQAMKDGVLVISDGRIGDV